jgi:quinol-cytochrome oxidoreductase complex cytochrome b subunit
MTKADSKIHKLLVYFSTLTLTFHNTTSLLGFFAFLVLVGQLISGIMLAIGFVADTMLIPMTRDEEDLEDLYSGDFSWLHERCLDFLFIFVYCHLFRKLYLLEFELETESA